ncbi:hypothetical protein OQA88_197 [Cercophora sp. LCS_1]
MARSLAALLFLPLIAAHASQKPLTDLNLPVAGFVSLGDSYSAGIGTTSYPTTKDCRLGTGAYPYLLALDLLPSGPNSTSFQWLSCTGSTTTDILSSPSTPNTTQVDLISTSPTPSFATLSIGGNDLGFFPVLNACIFRFYSFSSGSCESALAAAEAAVESPEFGHKLRLIMAEILDTVKWEKHGDFVVTVTGYAKFFDAETEECEDTSLGVWWGVEGSKLTKELRGRINRLVEGVNGRIEQIVRETKRAVFVDVDGVWEGHRFCEKGVMEPDGGREGTWFFLPGGGDSNSTEGATAVRDGIGKREREVVERIVNDEECEERVKDWGEMALCRMAMAKRRDPGLRLKGDLVWEEAMWYVPTYYGKTFHPRSRGHEAIRDRIYEVWRDHGIKFRPLKEVGGGD